MTESVNDVLGAVEPYERYRDFDIEGLPVRVTIPDGVQEAGGQGVSTIATVYELVDGDRGRFLATVYRLDSDLPALAYFNVQFERVLSRESRNDLIDLVQSWWNRRCDWQNTHSARRRAKAPRQR